MTEPSRYHRQVILSVMGPEAQRRLQAAHAMIVGCGALGCAVADLLCRAGVGALTIIDRDVVELTNLQRQTLFDEDDARRGTPKAEAARARLAQINGEVRLNCAAADLTPANAEALAGLPARADGLPPVGLVIDATDNFETRLLLNDLAVKHGLPFIYAGVVGTRATTIAVRPGAATPGPCLRCLVGQSPAPGSTETCDTAGVFGPAVAMVGAAQAAEAIRILSGQPDDRPPMLLEFDPWASAHRQIDLSAARDPSCPCCAHKRFEFLEGGAGSATARLCGRNAVQVSPDGGSDHALDLDALARRLAPHGAFEITPFALRGVLSGERGDEGDELHLTVFRDGRTIVRGTTRPERARALCARYLG